MIPTEQCTAVVVLKPEACRRCGKSLAGEPTPWRHQVWELPEIKPLVTEVEGVEPTNNASERASRPAVIWRSFGTQSPRGSRFVETILIVVETCHRQSRNSCEFLTQALQAHFAGQPTPSLIEGV